jgi:hypothetical protein
VRGWGRAIFAIVGACMVFSGSVRAQSLFEKLVNPGPLVEGHAKYEADCDKCHESFSRHTQSKLCLDCHKEIAADRAQRARFHGRQRNAFEQECRHCHGDHKGRDADIVQLDREAFDHNLTNYPLVDSHKAVRCEGCHAPKTPFHKTSSVCFDCHKRVDPHKSRLEKCEACHAITKWRSIKPYDHSKTKFALEGAHKNVGCATCHVGEIYKDLARTCDSCHRLQDVHGGRYGPKCETCHDQIKWKNARFDHDKTKFPLRGAHVKTKCDACHTGDLYRDKLQSTCVSCHEKQDPHKKQLGARCEQCHGEEDWRKITFDHNLTHFPLIGLHATVPCEECHRTLTYKDAPTACEKCHKDEHHLGRLGVNARCATCHTPNAWSRWRFDHARQTKYPLTGAHQKLLCESCHSVKNATSLKISTACESCHKDFHEGRLGAHARCETCHNTTAWSQWRYDHATQAHYPLTGAHAKLKCEACHTIKNAPSLKIATDCISCHRKDDTHRGAFGPKCDRCHTTTNWRKVEIRD